MTPGARAAAAIDCLDRWLRGPARIEPILRDWGRANRFAGSGDRRAIADIVYDCVRSKRSYGWMAGVTEEATVTGRHLIHGWAQNSGDTDAIFTGSGYAPPALTATEKDAAQSLDAAPRAIRLNVPDWLLPDLSDALGDRADTALLAFADRAPVDLRVNRIICDPAAALKALAKDEIIAEPLAMASDALRCEAGARIANSRAFLGGMVELQDAASQAAVLTCAGLTGASILDFCAGGGGKALALASMTGGKTPITAHDIHPKRMRDLPARATRAGAQIEIADTATLTSSNRLFDFVFVDAPCSGSGTWRRDPEAKWNLSRVSLSERIGEQAQAFASARAHLKPGGHIVYATCSVLPAENEDQAERFAAEHSLTRLKAQRWHPADGTDGFFCAIFKAPADARPPQN